MGSEALPAEGVKFENFECSKMILEERIVERGMGNTWSFGKGKEGVDDTNVYIRVLYISVSGNTTNTHGWNGHFKGKKTTAFII